MKDDGKAVDGFFKQRRQGFGRDVAPGEPGPPRRDDNINGLIVDPGRDGRSDCGDVVADDGPCSQSVARLRDES